MQTCSPMQLIICQCKGMAAGRVRWDSAACSSLLSNWATRSEQFDQDLPLVCTLGDREKADCHLPGGTVGDCPSRASRPCPGHRYSGLDSPHGFYLQKLSECQHPTTFSRLFNSDNCCYCVLCLVNLYTQSYLILPAAF